LITDSAFPTDSIMYEGMSLLDYFAAKAMQALVTHHGAYCDDTTSCGRGGGGSEDALDVEEVADYAYCQADAMMVERKRRSEVKE
jgi:hypothetical protein